MDATLTIQHANDDYHFMWIQRGGQGTEPVIDTIAGPLQNAICLVGTTPATAQLTESIQKHIHAAAETLVMNSNGGSQPSSTHDAENRFSALGRVLFSQLVPSPIRAEIRALPPGSTIRIVADQANLPWEAMHDGTNFLALKHIVSRLAISDSSQERRNAPVHSLPRHSLLLGNPTGDLPATEIEIDKIADILYEAKGRMSFRSLFGQHITRLQVQELLATRRYDLIHFAGHATPDGLEFYDGEFGVAEIMSSLHNHPMVILNACATAQAPNTHQPQPQSTEQTENGAPDLSTLVRQAQSLTSSFIQGGARAVVGTLWPVPDEPSQQFSQLLYAHLIGGCTIGEAVRRTRYEMQEQHFDAICWLAPVLYGDPSHRLLLPTLQTSHGTVLTLHFDTAPDETHNEAYAAPHNAPQRTARKASLTERPPQRQAHYLAEICDCIAQHEGTIVSVDATRVSAVFGVYSVNDRSPVEAILAAREVHVLANHWGIPLPGAAIAMGTLSSSYTDQSTRPNTAPLPLLLGAPVREAQALAAVAAAGQILLTQRAQQGSRDEFTFNSLDPVPLWGRSTLIYEVISTPVAVSSSQGLDVDASVGREAEMLLLRQAWQDVLQERGQIVGIRGEAGIGKSHLVRLLQQQIGEEAGMWVSVSCAAHTRNTPYGLLMNLFRALLHVPDAMPKAELAHLLQDRFATASNLDISPLVDLLGVSTGNIHLQEQAVYHNQLYHLLQHLLVEALEEEQRPLVLVLEDMHQSDSASIDVVTQLVNEIEWAKILLILAYRPTWQPSWNHKSYFRLLPLSDLDPSTRQQLYAELLHTAALPPALVDLTERFGGNPLFLKEILFSLMERGLLKTLDRTDGASNSNSDSASNGNDGEGEPDTQWEMDGIFEARDLPGSVQLVIDMRLKQLESDARKVLEMASVLETHITPDALQWGLSMAEDALIQHLNRLTSSNFLSKALGRDRYTFRHDLIREVVYVNLPASQRQVWHRQVGDALRANDTGTQELSSLLAHHYYHSLVDDSTPTPAALHANTDLPRGALPTHHIILSDVRAAENALHYLLTSGNEALERHGGKEAVTSFQRAKEVQALLPEDAERMATIEGFLGNAYEQTSQFDEASHAYALAHSLLHRSSLSAANRARVANLARLLARLHMRRAHHEIAERWIVSGLERVQAYEDATCQSATAMLHIHRGSIFYEMGNYDEAARSCQKGVQIAQNAGDENALAEGNFILGAVLQSGGHNDEALASYQRALEIHTKREDLYHIHRVEMNMGVAYFGKSDWPMARSYYEKATRFWEKIGELDLLGHTTINTGLAELYLGNWTEAEAYFRRALSIWSKVQNQRSQALCHSNLGTLFIESGEWPMAKQHLEQCLEIVQNYKIDDYLSDTYIGLAQVALHENEPKQALELAQQAHGWASRVDQLLYQGIALRTEGRALAALGRFTAAYERLQQSMEILERLGDAYEAARTRIHLAVTMAASGYAGQALAMSTDAIQSFETLGASADLRHAIEIHQKIQASE